MRDQQQDDRPWNALGLALQLGYLIAIPIVVLALLGRFLDRRWGTSPWLLLAGILLSVVVSSVLVVRKARGVIEHPNASNDYPNDPNRTLGRP